MPTGRRVAVVSRAMHTIYTVPPSRATALPRNASPSQPHAPERATPRARACHPVCWSQRPRVLERATPCVGASNRFVARLPHSTTQTTHSAHATLHMPGAHARVLPVGARRPQGSSAAGTPRTDRQHGTRSPYKRSPSTRSPGASPGAAQAQPVHTQPRRQPRRSPGAAQAPAQAPGPSLGRAHFRRAATVRNGSVASAPCSSSGHAWRLWLGVARPSQGREPGS